MESKAKGGSIMTNKTISRRKLLKTGSAVAAIGRKAPGGGSSVSSPTRNLFDTAGPAIVD
jgi:hypothetical protein